MVSLSLCKYQYFYLCFLIISLAIIFRQSKEYEKERRDRLNKAFDQLSSVLPDYDPISSLSKVEILTKAYDYIKKLEADQCKPSQTMDGSCGKNKFSIQINMFCQIWRVK